MPRTSRLAGLALIAALAVAMAACSGSHLTLWTPVESGADLAADHLVRYERVVIEVRRVGVYDKEGFPTAEVRTHNQSEKPVAFGIDGFRLEIDGVTYPALLDSYENPSIYLEPGAMYNTRVTFAVNMHDRKATGTDPVMRLHLAPLLIDDVYHDLPPLGYREPAKSST